MKGKGRKKIVALAVLAIVIIGLFVYFYARPASALENTWQAGAWRQNIELVFKDGSKKEIDFSTSPSQEFFYQGREFVGFNYKISAKATSTDYTSIAIDYSEFQVVFAIASYNYSQTFTGASQIVIFPDGNWYQITNFYIAMSSVAPGFSSVGTFDFSITPDGVIKYNPDNTNWTTATLPIPTTISIQNKGHMEFELGDEVSPTYTTILYRPNANGSSSTFSVFPTTTQHWDAVDDTIPNNDTDYVYRRGTGNRNDMYNIPNHDVINQTGNISSVTVFANVKTTGTGTTRYEIGINSGGTVYWGPLFAGSSITYNLFLQTWYTNPKTALAWTWADIDALQIGGYVQGSASTSEGRITQLFCVVKYQPVI